MKCISLSLLVVTVLTVSGCTEYSSVVSKSAGPAIRSMVINGRTDFETQEEYATRTGVQKLQLQIMEPGDPENKWYMSSYDADRDLLIINMNAYDQQKQFTEVYMGAYNRFAKRETYSIRFKNLPNIGGIHYQVTVPHKEFSQFKDKIQIVMEYKPQTFKYNPAGNDEAQLFYTASVNLLKMSVVNTENNKVYWSKEFKEQNEESIPCSIVTGTYRDNEGKTVMISYQEGNPIKLVSKLPGGMVYENTLTGQYEDGFIHAGVYKYSCATKEWLEAKGEGRVVFKR